MGLLSLGGQPTPKNNPALQDLGTVNVERYLSGRQPVSIAVHCSPNSTNNGVAASESWL